MKSSPSCSYLGGEEKSFCTSDTAGCDGPLILTEQSCDESAPSLYIIMSPRNFKCIHETPRRSSFRAAPASLGLKSTAAAAVWAGNKGCNCSWMHILREIKKKKCTACFPRERSDWDPVCGRPTSPPNFKKNLKLGFPYRGAQGQGVEGLWRMPCRSSGKARMTASMWALSLATVPGRTGSCSFSA